MQQNITNPEAEQKLCVSCGFCCDGTLFELAWLLPAEKGILPEKLEPCYLKNKEGEFFTLPCPYFNKKCTIYNQKKPNVCSDYRCKLLKGFSKGEISMDEAMQIIHNAFIQRDEIIKLLNLVLKSNIMLPFRQIKKRLYEFQPEAHTETERNQAEMLAAKFMICEILLIKHFFKESEFNKILGIHEMENINTKLPNHLSTTHEPDQRNSLQPSPVISPADQ